MSKRKRTHKTSLIVMGGVVAAVVAVVGYAIIQQFAGDSDGLSNSQTSFSVTDRVGQPAPEFTATNVDGLSYTFKPGDGRPKTLVFYMGYG